MTLFLISLMIITSISGMIRMFLGAYYFGLKRKSKKFNHFMDIELKKGPFYTLLMVFNPHSYYIAFLKLVWFVSSNNLNERKPRLWMNVFSGIAIGCFTIASIYWMFFFKYFL